MLAVYGDEDALSTCGNVLSFFPTVSVAMEAIGDITASAEVSRVEVDGEDFDSRIQGGVLVRLPSTACRTH